MKNVKIVMLIITLMLICAVFYSCGDNSVTSLPTPGPAPISTAMPPFNDPQLKILTDAEIASGKHNLWSSVINSMFSKGRSIKGSGVEPLEIIMDVADVFDMITEGIEGNSTANELNNISNQVNGLSNQVGELSTQINQMENEFLQNQDIIINNQDMQQVNTLETNIESIYGNANTPNTPGTFMFLCNQSLLIANDPNNTNPNHISMPLLQSDKTNFENNPYNTNILSQVNLLNTAICPINGNKSCLTTYANCIITNNTVNDPNSAMTAYIMLENYFLQIISYQLEGAAVNTNILNDNPLDPNHTQSALYMSTLQTQLKAEVIQYLKTVNYLAVNILDYRDPKTNIYVQDMNYHDVGIASDPVYINMLARSRFVCALIMQPFEQDFGLYGAIVTPYNYTDGSTPVTTITLNFTGPQSFSMTVPAQKILSQFPYTQYSGNTASPDNSWLFYDFSTMNSTQPGTSYFDPNLPGGTYNITFNDNNGSNSYPWPHLSNQLGTVTVNYYDPNNLDSPPTITPTGTNTLKFGYFSGRWSWGFQRMSFSNWSQWIVPKTSGGYFPDGSKDSANPTCSNIPSSNYSVSPPPGNGIIRNMAISVTTMKTSNDTRLAYLLQLPVTIQQGGQNLIGGSSEVQIFSNCTQDSQVNSSNSTPLYYGPYIAFGPGTIMFGSNGSPSSGILIVAGNTYENSGNQTGPLNEKSPKNFSYTPNTSYNLLVSEQFGCVNYSGDYSQSSNQSISWDVQLVYSGTYNNYQQ